MSATPSRYAYVNTRLKDINKNADELERMVSPDTVIRARDLIFAALEEVPEMCAPNVCPTGDGGVEFLWHIGGWHITIEAGLDENWSWCYDGVDTPVDGDPYHQWDELTGIMREAQRRVDEREISAPIS